MEEASLRFPHLTEQILEKLDNVSLTKLRKVSNSWQYLIDNQKEVWIRKIKIHINCSKAYVKNILRKKNTETLAALANGIQQLYTNNKFPVHSAAINGHLEVFNLIFDNAHNKNPKGPKGMTPLHHAAENGHSEVCRVFLKMSKTRIQITGRI